MPHTDKLKVIFCWHMHQPEYRRVSSGDFALPWTYLHALKDYTDMAWHIENQPGARAVFNFVPVLLDQVLDYKTQFESGQFRDPLLRALAQPDLHGLGQNEKAEILKSCFRVNVEHMLNPFPAYRHLYELHQLIAGDRQTNLHYLSEQYFTDLLMWYHLAWSGESLRRTEEEIPLLMAKGSHFSWADRQTLLSIMGRAIADLVPRYRRLAEDGRIELSTTPYYHPILPLLLDLDAARDALPNAPLPQAAAYPGGRERAAMHVEYALRVHHDHFGLDAAGMWPAEGGVSQAALALMAAHGVQWAATGENVLYNSLLRTHEAELPARHDYLYRPYRVAGSGDIACFFRDDTLSDWIGFEYSKWFGRDAVHHFINALEEIRHLTRDQPNPVVSIILDGENAWEYYPYNGHYFLSGLYKAVAEHPHLEMTTFRDYLAAAPATGELTRMVAGSWVYGNFSTWIGSPEKNRAWDLLCDAKAALDHTLAKGQLSDMERRPVLRQLAVCEGSDWFWWFGDYNPAESVRDFDALFRENLSNLYKLLKLDVPESLTRPLSVGHGQPASGGVMRRGSEI